MKTALSVCMVAALLLVGVEAGGIYKWRKGSATHYGGADAGGTMGGACGYGNLYATGYGQMTAAASISIWKGGLECGTCYQVKCLNSKFCYAGKSIVVTVTNFCPAGGEGWCNAGRSHLDMSIPAYTKIAEYRSGIVNTMMRRVQCVKSGNIMFSLYGNPWFLQMLITNVAGPGNIQTVLIKGNDGPWHKMSHNWGMVWHVSKVLVGQSLSIKIITLYPRQRLTLWYTIPKNWGFGGSYKGNKNFKVTSSARKALELPGFPKLSVPKWALWKLSGSQPQPAEKTADAPWQGSSDQRIEMQPIDGAYPEIPPMVAIPFEEDESVEVKDQTINADLDVQDAADVPEAVAEQPADAEEAEDGQQATVGTIPFSRNETSGEIDRRKGRLSEGAVSRGVQRVRQALLSLRHKRSHH